MIRSNGWPANWSPHCSQPPVHSRDPQHRARSSLPQRWRLPAQGWRAWSKPLASWAASHQLSWNNIHKLFKLWRVRWSNPKMISEWALFTFMPAIANCVLLVDGWGIDTQELCLRHINHVGCFNQPSAIARLNEECSATWGTKHEECGNPDVVNKNVGMWCHDERGPISCFGARYRVCFLRVFDFCMWCSGNIALMAVFTCFYSAGATSEAIKHFSPLSLQHFAISVCHFCLNWFSSTLSSPGMKFASYACYCISLCSCFQFHCNAQHSDVLSPTFCSRNRSLLRGSCVMAALVFSQALFYAILNLVWSSLHALGLGTTRLCIWQLERALCLHS